MKKDFHKPAMAYKIHGYIWSDWEVTEQEAFDRAKIELVKDLHRDIEVIKDMNFKDFMIHKKRGFK